jgi:hypothetical protein
MDDAMAVVVAAGQGGGPGFERAAAAAAVAVGGARVGRRLLREGGRDGKGMVRSSALACREGAATTGLTIYYAAGLAVACRLFAFAAAADEGMMIEEGRQTE